MTLLGPYLRTIATFEERKQALSEQTQLGQSALSGKVIWSLFEQLNAGGSVGRKSPR